MAAQAATIKQLDHLGLVAGFCHEISLPRIIDKFIPKHSEHNVSHGESVLAMILNGLGFRSRTLHMFSDFFEHKPTDKLIGNGVLPEHLNDDVLGRTLDALYDANVSMLYQVIAEHVVQHLGLSSESVHLDITSFHVDGEYGEVSDEGAQRLELTKGYSRDHRPELNQVILELICENQAGIPVYMQALSGNTNDSKAFAEVTKNHIKSLKAAQRSQYLIGDAALYTPEAIQSLHTQSQTFITRVPMTINLAKQALLNLSPSSLVDIGGGYAASWLEVEYAEVPQRWLLIRSEDATKREMATWDKKLRKLENKERKAFDKLKKKEFACQLDAQTAALEFSKQCQVLALPNLFVFEKPSFKGRGRPSKNAVPTGYSYQIQATPTLDEEKIKLAKAKVGMFILATNDTLNEQLTMSAMLSNYKSQQKVERGFRFLKSPEFLTSSLFLKKPERIEALLMVMTLSLLVYAGLEHKIRQELAKDEAYFPSMVKNKATDRSTARWVFLKFEGIHILDFQGERFITGLKGYQLRLLKALGKRYEAIYSVSTE